MSIFTNDPKLFFLLRLVITKASDQRRTYLNLISIFFISSDCSMFLVRSRRRGVTKKELISNNTSVEVFLMTRFGRAIDRMGPKSE